MDSSAARLMSSIPRLTILVGAGHHLCAYEGMMTYRPEVKAMELELEMSERLEGSESGLVGTSRLTRLIGHFLRDGVESVGPASPSTLLECCYQQASPCGCINDEDAFGKGHSHNPGLAARLSIAPSVSSLTFIANLGEFIPKDIVLYTAVQFAVSSATTRAYENTMSFTAGNICASVPFISRPKSQLTITLQLGVLEVKAVVCMLEMCISEVSNILLILISSNPADHYTAVGGAGGEGGHGGGGHGGGFYIGSWQYSHSRLIQPG
jgi:hypothetical protein